MARWKEYFIELSEGTEISSCTEVKFMKRKRLILPKQKWQWPFRKQNLVKQVMM